MDKLWITHSIDDSRLPRLARVTVWQGQSELWQGNLEGLTIAVFKRVMPTHAARRLPNWHAAVVFVTLTRCDHGLLTDDALAVYLVRRAIAIADHEVPRAQLHGMAARIGEGHEIHVKLIARVAVTRRVQHANADLHGLA